MIGPEGDTRQCTKQEIQSSRRERTSARSSGAIKSEGEVGDNSGGEGHAGQDKAGEKGTGTARGGQRRTWGTSRRGEPSGWSVQDRAARAGRRRRGPREGER